MKKYIVPFLFVAVSGFCLSFWGACNKTIATANQYKAYVSSLEELNCSPNDCYVTDLGFCYEIVSNSQISTKNTKSTLGFSMVYFCKENEVNKKLDNIGFVVKEKYKIDDIVVFEGKINNKEKAQVAFSKGQLTVGIPVVFGSY